MHNARLNRSVRILQVAHELDEQHQHDGAFSTTLFVFCLLMMPVLCPPRSEWLLCLAHRVSRTSSTARAASALSGSLTMPCTSSRPPSQARRLCEPSRKAACSRAYPYSRSSTASNTNTACRPPSAVRAHALAFAPFSLPLAHRLPTAMASAAHVWQRVKVPPGLYGIAQYVGFSDDAALRIDEIVTRVSE